MTAKKQGRRRCDSCGEATGDVEERLVRADPGDADITDPYDELGALCSECYRSVLSAMAAQAEQRAGWPDGESMAASLEAGERPMRRFPAGPTYEIPY